MGYQVGILLSETLLFSVAGPLHPSPKSKIVPSTLHHEQTIPGEEMHALITFMVSIMASDI